MPQRRRKAAKRSHFQSCHRESRHTTMTLHDQIGDIQSYLARPLPNHLREGCAELRTRVLDCPESKRAACRTEYHRLTEQWRTWKSTPEQREQWRLSFAAALVAQDAR